MLMILRGMKNAMDKSKQNKENMLEAVRTMISYNWIRHLFKGDSEKEHFGYAYAGDALQIIMTDNKSKFHKTIEGLIKTLLAEDLLMAPDSMQQMKSKNTGKNQIKSKK